MIFPWEAAYKQTQRCDSRRPYTAIDLRAGYDDYKRKKGSKVHMAVDMLGHLLAVHVTGETVNVAFADQGYMGGDPAQVAQAQDIDLHIVKLPETKKGVVLQPRRWVVERSFGWLNGFRRLIRDYERQPETLAGLHFVVFAILMLTNMLPATSS